MTKGSDHSRSFTIDHPAPDQDSTRTVLQVIIPIFRRYKGRLLLGFFILICVDIIQLLIPVILKSGVDSLAADTATPGYLLALSLMILSAACCVMLFRFFWRYLIIGFSRILEKKVRDRLLEHLLSLDQAFFDRKTTGDLVAHAGNDLSVVQMACGMGLVAAADALFMSTAAICFMALINGKLTLIALMPMPVLALCTKYLSGYLHKRYNRVQEQFSQLTEFVRATLMSIRLIQGYTLENFQQKRFQQIGEQYVKSNLRVAMIQGALFPVSTLVGNLGMLLVLFFGGSLVIKKVITLGDFVAFITYMYMLIWPMMAVGWVSSVVQRGMTSLRRIHNLLEERPVVVTSRNVFSIDQGQPPDFRLVNLSFTYPGTVRQCLTGINLDISTGILGITGRTGSGKSTLCKLLLRMYPATDRALYFNHIDVNTLSVEQLRKLMAYVPQEPVVFSDTIVENIRFGQKDAEFDEVVDAAKAAALHDDILSFQGQYEAVVGEQGVKLSGGQRQRLSLARALISRRPILIIDDGLSAVDVETEQAVLKGIVGRSDFSMVIIVSHRISVLEICDRVLVLDDGRLVAEGTNEQLADNAFYAAMKEKQRSDA